MPQDNTTSMTGNLHRVILATYYSLLTLFLFISLTALPSFSVATPIIWLLQSLPLLLFIKTVHRSNARQFIWLSLVVLLYFMHGVLVAFEPERKFVGFLEIFLSSLLFCELMLYLKLNRSETSD